MRAVLSYQFCTNKDSVAQNAKCYFSTFYCRYRLQVINIWYNCDYFILRNLNRKSSYSQDYNLDVNGNLNNGFYQNYLKLYCDFRKFDKRLYGNF